MGNNHQFFSRILLPSLIAIFLFIAVIYLIIIPSYRDNLMNSKRQTIRELTNTAWSVMHKLDRMVNDTFDIERAKREAALIISDMRYGDELKDYYWITDTTPIMVMHPYRPSMNGMDLTEYRDPRGKNFFVDIVEIVRENGDGYVDYKWQWKDDSLTVVPKLSYVKAYEPWGWIVGTGIYIEDVNREISNISRKIVWLSFFITFLIGTIISYLARRNYIVEQQRQNAQNKLQDSMQRYKKLVESATDGVIMMLENEIVYCNPYLLNILGYSQSDFELHNKNLFQTISSFIHFDDSDENTNEKQANPIEQQIKKQNGNTIEVVVTRLKFELDGKEGMIFTVKDVSNDKLPEYLPDTNIQKLKSLASIMNMGLFTFSVGKNPRFVDVNDKFLELLGYSEKDIISMLVFDLFEVPIERDTIVNAFNKGEYINETLVRILRANGSVLPALVSIFPVHNSEGKVVLCEGIILDAHQKIWHQLESDKFIESNELVTNYKKVSIKDYLQRVPSCNLSETVESASKLMNKNNSSLIIVTDEKENPVGIVTYGDINRRVISCGKTISTEVASIMSSPVIHTDRNASLLEALSAMHKNGVKNLIVRETTNSKNFSCFSIKELLNISENSIEKLAYKIEKVETIDGYKEIVENLPSLTNSLMQRGYNVAQIGKLVSEISDAITIKLIKQAIAEIGEPPAPFVFLALGSEGRREQTLATDQDNAIVFNPPNKDTEEQCQEYFLLLGSKVCSWLSMAGYPLCVGNVMAMNPEWCMSLENWKIKVNDWITNPNPQEVLNTSIFFDFRAIYGNQNIVTEIQDFYKKLLEDNSIFFFNFAKSILNIKVPAIDENDWKSSSSFDIKLPILALTSIARLWSLKHSISERNTTERFLTLQAKGIISESMWKEFDKAFSFLMMTRFRNQIRQDALKETINNKVNLFVLSEFERVTLKNVISTVSNHQNRLSIEFRMI